MTIEQIIERIIEQEIFVNASTMVTNLCNEGSHWTEHLIDCMGAPDYSEPPADYTVRFNTETQDYDIYAPDGDFIDNGHATEEDAIKYAWDLAGDTPEAVHEALQFWLVSDWLADKLEQVGAPLARDVLGFNVWGRTECGQSLTIDSTLHAVANLIK